MSEVRFVTRIPEDGRLSLGLILAKWIGLDVTVTVEPVRSRRSNQANRRYWGRTVRGVLGYLNPGREIPLSDDQVHYVLASSFLGVVDTPLGPVPRHTKTLTDAQFADYMDRIEAHFIPLGAVFPERPDWGRDENGEHGTGGWIQ